VWSRQKKLVVGFAAGAVAIAFLMVVAMTGAHWCGNGNFCHAIYGR
jgi:hypothetical protein